MHAGTQALSHSEGRAVLGPLTSRMWSQGMMHPAAGRATEKITQSLCGPLGTTADTHLHGSNNGVHVHGSGTVPAKPRFCWRMRHTAWAGSAPQRPPPPPWTAPGAPGPWRQWTPDRRSKTQRKGVLWGLPRPECVGNKGMHTGKPPPGLLSHKQNGDTADTQAVFTMLDKR